MDNDKFTSDSFLNHAARDVKYAAGGLIVFSIVTDVVLLVNDIFAPFWPFLALFVPLYLAASNFRAALHINSQCVFFERRLWGWNFDKVRLLDKAQYIDLQWTMKSGGETGRRGRFSLAIEVFTTELTQEPGIYLGFDLHYGPEAHIGFVVDKLYQLHRATGLPLQFDTLAAERFYEAYVEKYGLEAILNPMLIA